MPVLFAGHGSPMNAIEDNRWSRGFKGLRDFVGRPRSVLAISAHWTVGGTFLTDNERPQTIHDFGGFPKELYTIEYPAPGDPDLAARTAALLEEFGASLRSDWGLDHGTWSVLRFVFPDADVPVVQLSIDGRRSSKDHLEIGRAIAPLREEGVLIFASGNVVHNLGHAMAQVRAKEPSTPAWASAFDAGVARALEARDEAYLVGALETPDGRMAHPTPDHYFPLLYAFGASERRDAVRFPITGFDLGSLSMRAVLYG